jgi:hypothetical protein
MGIITIAKKAFQQNVTKTRLAGIRCSSNCYNGQLFGGSASSDNCSEKDKEIVNQWAVSSALHL